MEQQQTQSLLDQQKIEVNYQKYMNSLNMQNMQPGA